MNIANQEYPFYRSQNRDYHVASLKAAPHPSGSRIPIAPIFNGDFLKPLVPGMVNKEKSADNKKTEEYTTQGIAYKVATWQKVTDYPSFAGVKLLVLLRQDRPSLLPANR